MRSLTAARRAAFAAGDPPGSVQAWSRLVRTSECNPLAGGPQVQRKFLLANFREAPRLAHGMGVSAEAEPRQQMLNDARGSTSARHG
jgi:hypothetical protein